MVHQAACQHHTRIDTPQPDSHPRGLRRTSTLPWVVAATTPPQTRSLQVRCTNCCNVAPEPWLRLSSSSETVWPMDSLSSAAPANGVFKLLKLLKVKNRKIFAYNCSKQTIDARDTVLPIYVERDSQSDTASP